MLVVLVFLNISVCAQADDMDILYIRGEFTDKPMTINNQTWRNRLNTLNVSLNRYWVKHSYKKITAIRATYTQELTFPGVSGDYMDVHKLRSTARNMASNAGFNLQDYDHVVYSYPSIKHSREFGALGSPGNIWLPGENPFDGGLIHEFGHALGLGHAHSIEGASGVIYPGEVRGGRDGLFMMGSDGQGRIGDYSTINLPMRYQTKFIDDRYIPIAKTDSTYRIWEFELDSLPSVRNLGVRVNVNGEDFWISYAPKMAERWANFDSAGFARGVLVHRKNNAVTSTLDFTPGSFNGTKNEEDFKDTRDGALQIGSSYNFPNSNVSIRPKSTGSAGGIRFIDVEIKIGNPSFSGTARNIGGAGSTTKINGGFFIRSSGGDVWNNADTFHYYSHQTGSRNGDIRAKVESINSGHQWGKSGVMLRENNSDTAKNVFVYVRTDGQVGMQWRNTTGARSMSKSLVGGNGTPKWVRVSKSGNKATGYYSLDGVNWLTIGSVNIQLGRAPSMGLAVSSLNDSNETTTLMTGVQGFAGTNNPEVFKYDFGKATSALKQGYQRVTASTSPNNIVWGQSGLQDRDRGVGDSTERDFVFGTAGGILRKFLTNGVWEVTWIMGDGHYARDGQGVKAEGRVMLSNIATPKGAYTTRSFIVEVKDGVLDLEFLNAPGGNNLWLVNALTLTKISDIN